MRECEHCQVTIKGDWETCPLCHQELDVTQKVSDNPYPDVPLKYNRQRGLKVLTAISILIVFASYPIALIWQGRFEGLQGAFIGIITMWLVALILIRKRRNLAKSILYLLVFLSLVCVYMDYLMGWSSWSTTYAVPIMCNSAIVGMLASVQFVKIRVGDYILYLMAAGLLGLIPALFLLFHWVYNPIPAWTSIILSLIMLALILFFQGKEMIKELHKRTFI